MSTRAPALPALSRFAQRWRVPLLLLVVALALRCLQFGNPVIQSDEQFYLLVGDRLLHGALPYVDIWDRKPVGLFLIYAAIRLLGGTGIVQYQIVASLFAAATAFVIQRAARRFATDDAATLAASLYLVWLQMLGGDGGQSPVFYNLFVAGAGLVTIGAATGGETTSRRLRFAGCAAMLLTGIAIQVKYTAMFEGVLFGLVLMWRSWRNAGRPAALLRDAALWILCALLPTLAALLVYAGLGHADAFVTANFQSFFLRSESDHGLALVRLLTIMAMVSPLAALAVLGRPARRGAARNQGEWLPLLWCLAGFGGILLCGSYYDHYALPLLVPLCIASAPGIALLRSGRYVVALLLASGAIVGAAIIHSNVRARGDGSQVRALTGYIRPRLDGTLYVFIGDPILYHLTGSPLPTRYSFPSHLNHLKEVNALGTSRDGELRRVLSTEPQFILTAGDPPDTVDPTSVAIVNRVLAARYHLVRTVRVGGKPRLLYQRTATAVAPRIAPQRVYSSE